MPSKMTRLLNDLAVREDRRTLEYAVLGADREYGADPMKREAGPRVEKWNTIFPPTIDAKFDDTEVDKYVQKAIGLKSSRRNGMYQEAEWLALESRILARPVDQPKAT
jgi:hypothetical protein